MAGDPLLLERLGRPIPETRMQIADVKLLEPCGERITHREGTGPLAQPEALLFQRPNRPLSIRVALRVVVAGEGLLNPQGPTGGQEAHRGGLAPVVAHQVQWVAFDPVGELAIDRHVQGGQPVRGRGLQPDVVADELLRVPVQHHYDVDPAERVHQDLRHVDAPPLVRGRRPRLVRRRGAARPEARIGLDQQRVLAQQAQHALLVDGQPIDIAQMRPTAPVAPEGVLGFPGSDASEDLRVPRGDSERRLAPHPSSASVFFTSSVRSATNRLSWLFSCARRATWSAC